MNSDDVILISVDDHIAEPKDMFDAHVPAKYKHLAPRVETDDRGIQQWWYGDLKGRNLGLNAVAGKPPEMFNVDASRYDEMRPGCYDVHERVRDMNAGGQLAGLNFPNWTGFSGQVLNQGPDPAINEIMIQAYNDWHVDEWCGTYPGRFIPLGIPPLWDPKLMADEIRRVAKKGCHAVSFTENPEKVMPGLPSLHSEHWDPFWQACSDEGTVVAIHIGSASGMQFTSMDSPVDVMITTTPISIMSCAADLLWSRVLRKFPKIRFALSKGGIGWIPYFLERADYVYAHHKAWTNQDFGDQLPSELFREKIITCFIDDEFGLKNRYDIGVDMINWECDYPHSDTTWPEAPEILSRCLSDVPDDEINKITHENAMRLFQYDPYKHIPKEQCTVGALRATAKGVDLSALQTTGGTPPSVEEGRPVTTADVAKQLASAFVSAD